MEVQTALQVLLAVVLVLGSVEHCECVRCFARFSQGRCEEELGEVDEDDCCQNPHYGHQVDGVCTSCGPPVWSPWSPWSQCNILCGDGVSQRTRTCFGNDQSACENAAVKLQMKPCNGSCCDAKGWGSWQPWSPCSVSCGGGGVRKRHRVCADPPECHSACSGASDETEECPTSSTCPVHGGWSGWSDWSQCSGSCISGLQDRIIPTRRRQRSCSNPAPSDNTVPPGNSCAGDNFQVQHCTELPNCPVDGSWGAWSPAGKCSVSCGEGLQLSIRMCDQPGPRYGGRFCVGPSTRATVCQITCPVDGFWTDWSSWGECSSSCISRGQAPLRTRHRSCSNPAPSTNPPGTACQGDNSQMGNCDHLPHCSVDGGWSAWSPFSSCSATCGVGLQVSKRKCDSPAPAHGGQLCLGEELRRRICETNVHCPVNGVWSEWSQWTPCKHPFGPRDIRCKHLGGSQTRDRQCLYRAHNGTICNGDSLTQRRVCYDVNNCYLKGSWDGWEEWSFCNHVCGQKSQRFRKRYCKPDYSAYNPTIGRMREVATFSGTPRADCGAAPEGGAKLEIQPCHNIPPCD